MAFQPLRSFRDSRFGCFLFKESRGLFCSTKNSQKHRKGCLKKKHMTLNKLDDDFQKQWGPGVKQPTLG